MRRCPFETRRTTVYRNAARRSFPPPTDAAGRPRLFPEVPVEACTRKSLLSWAVTLLPPLILLLIPSGEHYTPSIKIFFAISIMGIAMFCLDELDNAVAGILMMSLYAMTGLAPVEVVFSPWTTPIPWFILGTLLLVTILEDTSILKRIACKCIILAGGTYSGIVWGVTFTAAISIVIVPGTWTCLAVAALCVSIIRELGFEQSRAAGGIMMAACFGFHGASAFVYSPSGMGMFLEMSRSVAVMDTNFLDYFVKNWIFLPLPFIMAFIIARLMRPEREIDGRTCFMEQLKALGPMRSSDRKVLLVLIGLMLYLFTAQWHGGNMLWGFLVAPVALFLPGLRIGRREHFSRINFSVLFFIVACMSIGTVAARVGAGSFLTDAIVPMLGGAGERSFLTIVYFFGIIVNFLLTPLAAMSAICPLLAQISLDLGVPPMMTIFSFYMGLDQLLLPYEIGTYLIFFAFGLTCLKDFVRLCGIKMVLTSLWVMLAAIPWWRAVGF